MYRLKLFVIAVGMLISIGSPAHAQSYNAATLHFPPYSFENEQGEADGISVNIVKQIASNLGVDLNISVLPWARALEHVRTGRMDMLFTAYWTPERQAFLNYSSTPLIVQKVALYTYLTSPIKKYSDVAQGHEIPAATRRKVSYGLEVDKLLSSGVLNRAYVGNDDIQLLNIVKEKRAQIVPMSKFVAHYNIRKAGLLGQLREIPIMSKEVPSYVTFSKAKKLDALRIKFNRKLEAMHKSGEVDMILKDWLENNSID